VSAGPLPLEGLLVLDFSQFLAGPSASLRLADLGARVVKVERPRGGDPARALVLGGANLDGDSVIFHTINRNKESLAVDLRDADDLALVRRLVAHADVVIQGFRPGVMERYGLDYASVSTLNERVVYGSVSGFGPTGPWADRPGQDLLVQALSGLAWLTGNAGDPPLAMGLSVVDTLAGQHLCQGLLACLVRRGVTGRGGLVEVSLLESALDLAFEGLTAYLNDPDQLPRRSALYGAHPYLAAPYGIYPTADGHVALAMGSIPDLAAVLGLDELLTLDEPEAWFARRDEIKARVAEAVRPRATAELVAAIDARGLWCAEVLAWPELVEHEGFAALEPVLAAGSGPRAFRTTRCPIRVDGAPLAAAAGAPRLGEHAPLPGERTATGAAAS
jgi:crotonobetainyl-CoA:carnitine CoA-transferase CaiB-like acyl-CoA transferase